MPIPFEVSFMVVLVALAGGMVYLSFQQRPTCQTIESFLHSLSKDLSRIAEGVHVFRLRTDHWTRPLQASLSGFSAITQWMRGLGVKLNDLHMPTSHEP